MQTRLQAADPLTGIWLDTRQDRTPRVVLKANADHWNRERGPRLETVVFRNDLDPAEALRLACDTEGEVDIVTEVSPADASRVRDSQHARLVTTDAMRIVVGIINRARGLLQESGYPAGRPLILAALPGMDGLAKLLADDLRSALGVEVMVVVILEGDLLAAQHSFVEKVIPAPFDVLLFAWFDLTSDAPAAFMHSWLYGAMGAFRAGPPIPEFDQILDRYVRQTDGAELNALDEQMDRLAHAQALSLSLFLCAPQALLRRQQARQLRRPRDHLRGRRDRGL